MSLSVVVLCSHSPCHDFGVVDSPFLMMMPALPLTVCRIHALSPCRKLVHQDSEERLLTKRRSSRRGKLSSTTMANAWAETAEDSTQAIVEGRRQRVGGVAHSLVSQKPVSSSVLEKRGPTDALWEDGSGRGLEGNRSRAGSMQREMTLKSPLGGGTVGGGSPSSVSGISTLHGMMQPSTQAQLDAVRNMRSRASSDPSATGMSARQHRRLAALQGRGSGATQQGSNSSRSPSQVDSPLRTSEESRGGSSESGSPQPQDLRLSSSLQRKSALLPPSAGSTPPLTQSQQRAWECNSGLSLTLQFRVQRKMHVHASHAAFSHPSPSRSTLCICVSLHIFRSDVFSCIHPPTPL